MRFRPTSWFRQSARRTLAATLPRRIYLTNGPRQSRRVALTFDDGPHPELTPRLLDLLRELQVPSTFFVIGQRAEKHPELLRRMIAEGHAVGNHSYSHPPRESLSASQVADETARGSEAIAQATGRPVKLYRPPRGRVTARDLVRLWRYGLTTVLWNVDPKDYSKRSAEEIRRQFQGRAFQGGDVVLLHDTQPFTFDVLPELVAQIRSSGLEFATVEAWTE